MNGFNRVTAPAVFERLSALADPIRGRLLLALARQELSVREVQAVLQLPQSTVSRHLKVLADLGLVVTRSEGTSNWYRMPVRELAPAARRLWLAVRDEVAGSPAAARDVARLERVLAQRHVTSQQFFATAAGRWDKLRSELFGERPALVGLLGLLDEHWTMGDLGCGTGQLAATLAPFVRRVIGVDESPAMLRSARQRTRELANVELKSGKLNRAAAEESANREQMGHQWLGFAEADLRGWLTEAGFDAIRFVALPADPAAKGPALFAMTARAGSSR